MNDSSLRTHDLVRLRRPSALIVDTPAPPWVEPALQRSPWVVVRRGAIRDGLVPVGVRGMARAERFAALTAESELEDRLSPEDLVAPRHASKPAFVALSRVATVMSGRRWGPGGSVAFELATRVPSVTDASDLDLIIQQDGRLDPADAVRLLTSLVQAALPTRVDAMLETPSGGVLLVDLAARPQRVLVRTPDGARLFADPWTVE